MEVSREEALKIMTERNEPYKVELLEAIPEGETITIYKQNNFVGHIICWLDLVYRVEERIHNTSGKIKTSV